MYQALNKFQIEYQKVISFIHPTKFTNRAGKVKNEVNSVDTG